MINNNNKVTQNMIRYNINNSTYSDLLYTNFNKHDCNNKYLLAIVSDINYCVNFDHVTVTALSTCCM